MGGHRRDGIRWVNGERGRRRSGGKGRVWEKGKVRGESGNEEEVEI